MKKHVFGPGFEFLFSAGVVAALVVPQFLFAQTKPDKLKEINITIKGNDTTFNGKNLKNMLPAEKQEAITQINKTVKPKGPAIYHEMALNYTGADSNQVKYFSFKTDSAFRYNKGAGSINIDGMGNVPRMRYRMDSPAPAIEPFSYNRPVRVRTIRMGNTQNFDYNNTDKDGISTRISYRVTDAFADASQRFAGVTKTDLDLQDLTLTPQFSAGKTTLAFTLPAKTAAEVQLINSSGQTIWKDKTLVSNFSKSFTWGINGVFYLVVKQAGKTAVKQIIKE